MTFYSNKHPIRVSGVYGSNEEKILPVGSVFTVLAIFCTMIELKPIKKSDADIIVAVTPELLSFAFTETESIES